MFSYQPTTKTKNALFIITIIITVIITVIIIIISDSG